MENYISRNILSCLSLFSSSVNSQMTAFLHVKSQAETRPVIHILTSISDSTQGC